MDIGELDGFWVVTHHSNGNVLGYDFVYSLMEAHIVMRNGLFAGVGKGGVFWAGQASIEDDDVTITTVFDATAAPPNIFVLDENGVLSRDPVRHTDRLKLLRTGTRLVADGVLHRGQITVNVSVERLRKFDE